MKTDFECLGSNSVRLGRSSGADLGLEDENWNFDQNNPLGYLGRTIRTILDAKRTIRASFWALTTFRRRFGRFRASFGVNDVSASFWTLTTFRTSF